MAWAPRKYGPSSGRVEPVMGGSKEALSNPNMGSMLLNSMVSLSPSQLDNAIMEMLNIKNDNAHKLCQANPITKAGKRIQLMRMLGITMIPITILLALVFAIMSMRIKEFMISQDIRNTLLFSVEVSDLIHDLQKERDFSALYVSAIGPDTKQNLVARYASTDATLEKLRDWRVTTKNKSVYFQSRDRFQNYLNQHRYQLDNVQPTQKEELDYYSTLIYIFIEWFFTAITEAEAGTVWKQLVALQEVMQAKEMFGMERAYGSIYYIKGGFSSREEYLVFVESQDIANATLKAAREYSDLVEEIFQEIVAEQEKIFEHVIRDYRYEIRQNPFPVNSTRNTEQATFWFDNMTYYLDALLYMQKQLGEKIEVKLGVRENEDKRLLAILGLISLLVLILCPVILKAVYTLTCDIQNFSASLADKTKALNREKKRTDSLLYQLLPKGVAEQLKKNEEVAAESFTEVTVYFSDIVGFTAISSRSSPIQVVNMLDGLYSCFDDRIQLYDVYKVETIGDAYMVASGLPKRNGKRHAAEIATLALDLLDRVQNLEIPHMPGTNFKMRIGCHTGPVVAGIVGIKMPRYCLFGETVVMATHMEQSGAAGKIHISEATYKVLQSLGGFIMEERDVKEASKTFWLMHREGMVRCLAQSQNSMASEDYGDSYFNDDKKKEKQAQDMDKIYDCPNALLRARQNSEHSVSSQD